MGNAHQVRRTNGGGLPPALESTSFEWLGSKYEGKVRDSYVRGDQRILIATDRLSAFDRILTTVPLKGQVLTQLAQYWFERVSSIVEHHVVAVPDPAVVIGRQVSIIPIEVVVRGFLAGGGWREYSAGGTVSGVRLPVGLREYDQLREPIVTPSTKEPVGGHDVPISEAEIVKRGLVTEETWEMVRSTALKLFALGSRELAERGLLFADTKYEFGILNGRVVLADEIHTLDSSRFWMSGSYEAQRAAGEPPEMLDKEPIRRWLMARGFHGEGAPPVIDDAYRGELMNHYRRSFALLTGREFTGDVTPPLERIERNLRHYFA